jgi:hypothetical protein
MHPDVRRALDRVHAEVRAPRPPGIEACPCGCTPEALQAALGEVTRTAGPVAPLASFAFKAMTTWGDAAAYRYFLPRILELSLTEQALGLEWPQIGRKLAMAGVRDWPAAERDAVLGFFIAVGAALRSSVPAEAHFVELLAPVHAVAGSLRPLLDPWGDGLSDWLCFAGVVAAGPHRELDPDGARELRDWVWSRRAGLERAVERWFEEEPAVFYLSAASDALASAEWGP